MHHRVMIPILFMLLVVNTLVAQQPTITDQTTGTEYIVELVRPALFPVGMVFTDDGRLFYTEKTTGNVRVINADQTLQFEPVIHLPTSTLQERGMLGIELDPNYDENGYIWVFHTVKEP